MLGGLSVWVIIHVSLWDGYYVWWDDNSDTLFSNWALCSKLDLWPCPCCHKAHGPWALRAQGLGRGRVSLTFCCLKEMWNNFNLAFFSRSLCSQRLHNTSPRSSSFCGLPSLHCKASSGCQRKATPRRPEGAAPIMVTANKGSGLSLYYNISGLTLKALRYVCINHGDQRVLTICNHHKCVRLLFPFNHSRLCLSVLCCF